MIDGIKFVILSFCEAVFLIMVETRRVEAPA